MACRQILFNTKAPYSTTGLARFSTKSSPYLEKVGIPEFLNGIGKRVEAHVAKLESEIGDFQKHSYSQTEETWHPCQTKEADLEIHPQV